MKNLFISLLVLSMTFSLSMAQEEEKDKNVEVKVNMDTDEVTISKKEKLNLKLKDGAKPDVYIDGKKYDLDIVELIDPDNIESINVLKGEQALKEYNAPNGVVLITSKKEKQSVHVSGKTNIKIRSSENLKPKIIVDGIEVSRAKLKKLSPKEIETIEVVKGEKAIEEYDAPNGVVIVKTKKGKKK